MNSKAPDNNALISLCRHRLYAFLFLVLCWSASESILANDGNHTNSPFIPSIMVAGSDNTAFNLRFMDLLAQQLGGKAEIHNYSEEFSKAHPDNLIVTLGNNALATVQQQSPRPATLALMTEESQFASYLQQQSHSLSAIYYDATLLRQALLGKLILPQASQIAILVRPGFETHYDGLKLALAQYGLEIRTFTVMDEDKLIATLSRALSYGDFLLAIPDPVIYNPRTIKHILLTAYRRNRIVIGPGRAFVRAGVLASTYPPLEAIAKAAVQQIDNYLATGELLPPFHPQEFAVEINRQVAQSLNLPVPGIDELAQSLEQLIAEPNGGNNQ